MKNKCKHIRNKLQLFHDEQRELDIDLIKHITGCKNCREYHVFLNKLGFNLKSALDKEIQNIKQPGYIDRIIQNSGQRKPTKRRIFVIGAVAAIFLFFIIFFSINIYNDYSHSIILTEETKYFVKDLFATPLLTGVEYSELDLSANDNYIFKEFSLDYLYY